MNIEMKGIDKSFGKRIVINVMFVRKGEKYARNNA